MPIKGITYRQGVKEPPRDDSILSTNRKQNRYSNGFKLAVLDHLRLGKPFHAIAKTFGISQKTVNDIDKDVNIKQMIDDDADNQRKKHIGKIIFHYADLFLSGIKPEAIENMAIGQRVWCFGVLYDKYRLATGQSTENLNVHSINSNLTVELEKLKDMKDKLMTQVGQA